MTLSIDDARTILKAAGLRCTTCRVEVLRFLAAADSPLSHSDVADQLVPRGLDKSTIYRALMELADQGIASRLDLGDHVWRFEVRRQPSEQAAAEHPHFFCMDCGKVTCLPDFELPLPSTATPALDQHATITEILLKGHCASCQQD